MKVEEVLKLFPSPYFRKYQKETIEKMVEAFNSGYKVILLGAPTGTGKSFINTTFCRFFRSFYATPQLSLIDQIMRDKYLSRYYVEIKGRQNYKCYYDPTATVDVGVCMRIRDFSCDREAFCPYWKQKILALESNSALMSFSYLILEGRTETNYSFGKRDLLVLDESHSIDKYLLDHIDVVISPYTLPYGTYLSVEHLLRDEPKDISEVKGLVGAVLEKAKNDSEGITRLNLFGEELTKEDVKQKNKLDDFIGKAENFLDLANVTDWVWQMDWVTYRNTKHRKFVIRPVYARFFAKDMIWNRANRFIISSATILDPTIFVKEVGLDLVIPMDRILYLEVPSTFPVLNRPILDAVNGKLVKNEREENLPWAVKILEGILDIEEGKNVAVHCHSYQNANDIYRLISDKYKDRIILQTPETREEDLLEFMNSRGKVFLCVAFTEGQDWVGEICEAQVLFKVPYPDLSDKRVAKRLERKEWRWYQLEALKQVIQAYGRAVRRETDKARFYVIDKSFVNLIRRCRRYLPEWFKEALPKKWGGKIPDSVE